MQQFAPPRSTSLSARRANSAGKHLGRILLVDDYDDARDTVREALEQSGHVVIEAANGQQALNTLVSHSNDSVTLIVADLQMPVMDGWRLIELLDCYVKLSTIPIIVITAQDPQLERISHRGFFGYLQAPYELDELLEMVDACLSATAAQRAGATAH